MWEALLIGVGIVIGVGCTFGILRLADVIDAKETASLIRGSKYDR